jgi:hypothetical protein
VELQLVLERASHFFDDAQHRASTAAFETRPADSVPSPNACTADGPFTASPRQWSMCAAHVQLSCTAADLLSRCGQSGH